MSMDQCLALDITISIIDEEIEKMESLYNDAYNHHHDHIEMEISEIEQRIDNLEICNNILEGLYLRYKND